MTLQTTDTRGVSGSGTRTAGFIRWGSDGRFSLRCGGVAIESYLITFRLVREIAAVAHYARGRMLDVGCGTRPYAPLFAKHVDASVAVDWPGSQHAHVMDAYASGLELPFAAASFDFVLLSEVLEHLPDPERALAEIARVLRPGGRAVVSTPFMYRVHEPPYDFFRYTPFAHGALASRAGLDVVEMRTRGGYVTVLCDVLLKGLALGVGGLNAVWRKVSPRGRHLAKTAVVQHAFYWPQRLLAALLSRENVRSDVYTVGYVVVLEKRVKTGGGS